MAGDNLNLSIRLTDEELMILDHLAERMCRNKSDTVRVLLKRAAADPTLSDATVPPPVIIRVNQKQKQE